MVSTILGKTGRATGQALADVATIGISSERSIRRGEVLSEQLIAATERALHPPPPELIALTCNPTPVHQADHRTHPPTHRSAGLVTLATAPSTPNPRQPLPPPTSSTHMITVYGWSTSGIEPAGSPKPGSTGGIAA